MRFLFNFGLVTTSFCLFSLFTACSSSREGGDFAAVVSADRSGAAGGGNGPSSGLITAGEWNDLQNWRFWSDLAQGQNYTADIEKWGFRTANRVSVRVNAPDNSPVRDALVELYLGSNKVYAARSNQEGMAELFPGLTDAQLQVSAQDLQLRVNGIQRQEPVRLMAEGINYVPADPAPATGRTELAFIVDATGSMGDELNFLKEDLLNVIERIQTANANLDLLTASVFYRDEGEDYLTRHSGFTRDASATLGFIREQSASGGGDFPEAVHAALRAAINELQWSDQARTRIAFLLLDAPPHQNSQVMDEYRSLVKTAAAKGIRIVPVTASGIDKATEFLMRQTAIATNGTYVFITNDSGIGNDHLEATVGDYQVEFLNDLLVRLVGAYSR